jgi:rRNA-processing protein FCF1
LLEVFLDQQSLGIRKYLIAVGVRVRDDSEIRGNNDTSKSIPDEQVANFVSTHPGVILVTKDRRFGRQAKKLGLDVIFVDESEAVAIEVLRQLALRKVISP